MSRVLSQGSEVTIRSGFTLDMGVQGPSAMLEAYNGSSPLRYKRTEAQRNESESPRRRLTLTFQRPGCCPHPLLQWVQRLNVLKSRDWCLFRKAIARRANVHRWTQKWQIFHDSVHLEKWAVKSQKWKVHMFICSIGGRSTPILYFSKSNNKTV